jgi:hypothetical protein
MTPKKKRSLKRKAKSAYVLAWTSIALFILSFVFVALSHKIFGKPLAEVLPALAVMIYVMSLPFIAFGAIFVMQGYVGERRLYLRKICQYRIRKFFHQIMVLVHQGDFKKAVKIFNACNFKSEPLLEDYLVGMLINELQHSDDKELQELGAIKLNQLLIRFSPDSVTF